MIKVDTKKYICSEQITGEAFLVIIFPTSCQRRPQNVQGDGVSGGAIGRGGGDVSIIR